MTKQLIIGGTQSGSGKTLLSLALMAAFTKRGLKVQPFKCGPDFIDPGLHKVVTGTASYNLDSWMLSRETCRSVFAAARSTDSAPDIAIVEGVMGLFDGASGSDDSGSTAQIAKYLDAPVLLVVDGRSMARSFAAIVHGFTTMDSSLKFAGCIANKVGSANHKELITEAMGTYCPDIPLLGCMPRDEALEVPSRHLGLVTAEDGGLTPARVEALVRWAEENIDLDALLVALPDVTIENKIRLFGKSAKTRIAVAKDEAFCFCYPDNAQLLRSAGAEVVYFSPLHDSVLPSGISGLYLPGGYPELYAERLALNAEMRSAVAKFCHSGAPVYAECGGLMYLSDAVRVEDVSYPMCAVFDIQSVMDSRFRALGYREVTTTHSSLLGDAGTVARGHEFHYSYVESAEAVATIYNVTDRKGMVTKTCGYTTQNVVGSYVHLHFASNPNIPASIVAACISFKDITNE